MSRAIKTVVLLTFVLISLPMSAQFYNVRGTVYESSTLKGLPGAAVKITDAEGKMVAGKQTSQNGQFLLAGVPLGNYTLTVSFVGFKTQTFALKLDGKGGNKKIADVLMREDAQLMRETVVEGKMPEMIVVEDTTVYNASAFTVPVGSMVEELIKKLPGIVIDDNGTITHNGKTVSQILVDGKEFFGRNQQTVLKNIPAEIVEKIKAYDKQSDLARVTGIDDGEEQTVLDLEIKKDRRRGWFGQLSAGYGTHNRYNGRANINRFADKQKFSVVGNANNTQGNGMSDNQTAAASMNLEWTKLELNGGVNANFNQQSGASWSNSQSFENRNAAYSNRKNNNNSNGKGITTTWRIEWKPDSMTNIQMRPEFRWNNSRSHSDSESATFNNDPYAVTTDPLGAFSAASGLPVGSPLRSIAVNHNLGTNHNASDQISGSLSLQFNRRLKKRGRNITLNLGGGLNQNDGNSSNYSQIDYYQILAYTGQDSVYHKIQYDDSRNIGRNMNARISYSEPIAEGQFLQFSYNYSYRFNDRDRTVSSIFDPNVAPLINQWSMVNGERSMVNGQWSMEDYQHLATRDTAQCNYTENRYQNHDIRLQYRFIDTKWRVNVGFNLQPQVNSVDYTKGWKHYDVARTVVNWSPTLNLRYRFTKQEQIQVRYGGQSGQPSITDLIPDTLSNANPLNIRLGNPSLKPSFTHSFNAEYRKSIPDLQRSFNVNVQARATQNSVSNRTEYIEETGGRISRPENINGNWNASGNFNFNTAFSDQRFRVNSGTNARYTNAVSYVYQSASHETVKNTTRSSSFGENLRFSFRDDWLDVSLNGSFNYNHARSTATAASNLDTYNFSYGASTNMNWQDIGLNFSTDIRQQSRRGYNDAAMNTNQWIWNAQLSWSFLSRKQAILTLRWQDILGQRDMVSRNISSTARTDSDSERVVSYIMLSFTYRINAFGGRNRGPRDRGSEGIERGEGPVPGGDRGPGPGGDRGGFGGGGGFGGPR